MKKATAKSTATMSELAWLQLRPLLFVILFFPGLTKALAFRFFFLFPKKYFCIVIKSLFNFLFSMTNGLCFTTSRNYDFFFTVEYIVITLLRKFFNTP